MRRHGSPPGLYRRRFSGDARIALSIAPSARGKRMGFRRAGSLPEKPEGALLHDHEGGTEAVGSREAELEVHHHGRREGPGGSMRRLWFRLRAMLRRLLSGDARDEELSEEIRAYVEHDTESKIR